MKLDLRAPTPSFSTYGVHSSIELLVGVASLLLALAGCPDSWGPLAAYLESERARIGLAILGFSGLGYWASRVTYLHKRQKPGMKIDISGLGPEYRFVLTETECIIRRIDVREP